VIPSTYVPFRNGNLLAIGASWAEAIGAEAVAIGAVEADTAGYPDCRPAFFEAFQAAIAAGTRPGPPAIKILTPVIGMSKSQIVKRGAALGAPFQLSWSCYTNDEFACGKCDSCRLRLEAFAGAAMEDPIPYMNFSDGE
jgi:7-cyano-7-deazaguanine synthase